MLTSSTQLQNRSFQVVERTRTSLKCKKMKNARAKRAKILFFIVKYANFWGFCCLRRRGFLSSLITTHDNDVDDFYGCNGIEPANSALLHIAIKTTRNSFETWLAILLAVLIIVLFKLQYLNFIAE